MENMSLSDIAAVTRGNDDGDGWGGNGAWWIIVLFLAHMRSIRQQLWETMSLRRFTPL